MLKSFAITDIGVRRKLNEDYVFASDTQVGKLPNLYIVADGMGGHKAGDFASRYTVEHLVEEVRNSRERYPREILDEAIRSVNRSLYMLAETDEGYYGMGTTVVIATILADRILIANVGDSRLYMLQDKLRQVTVDHSLVEEMVLAGNLDARRARNHPDKNIITRAVGVDETVKVDYFSERLAGTKIILMCTDGLTNMLEDEGIEKVLRMEMDPQLTAELLVDDANLSGGKDNISVLLIYPDVPADGETD